MTVSAHSVSLDAQPQSVKCIIKGNEVSQVKFDPALLQQVAITTSGGTHSLTFSLTAQYESTVLGEFFLRKNTFRLLMHLGIPKSNNGMLI